MNNCLYFCGNNDYFYYNKQNLKIKLASIDKNGGVIIYANNNNNKTYINNQINFYNNLARSIININYSYNNEYLGLTDHVFIITPLTNRTIINITFAFS